MTLGEKSNILYLNHVSQMSGAEASLLSMLTHLNTSQFRPIVGLPDAGPFGEKLRMVDVQSEVIPHPRLQRSANPLNLLGQYFAMRRGAGEIGAFVDDHDIDLVHANSLSSAICAAKAIGSSIPLVYHARDLRLHGRAARWLVERVDAIIAISQAVAQRVADVAPNAATKTSVIPNGVDAAGWTAKPSRERIIEELGLPENARLIGGVGQLVPWKNWPRFLSVGADVAARVPEARLIIIGDDLFNSHPGYRRKLEQLAGDLAIGGLTHFLGHRSDVADVVSALDVFVHCADEEPLGRAIMEAMALERPVVAVNAAGPGELIVDGETGMLVPPRNTYAIADAVVAVLQDAAFGRRLGQAARARIEDSFRPEQTARLTEQLYQEVLWRRLNAEGAR